MEIDSNPINRKGEVSQCEFLFATEPDEDCRVTMDVELIYVYSFKALRKMTLVEDPLSTSILLILHLVMSSEMNRAS